MKRATPRRGGGRVRRFAAMHESLGTKPTWQQFSAMSAHGGRAAMGLTDADIQRRVPRKPIVSA